MSKTHPPVEIAFYGGLGEIGRNMATIEVDGRIAVVDCGVFFPNPEHLGVDLIIPDWDHLLARADDVEAVFITHGHMDHIGALPYLLKDFPGTPIYGTKLALAFIESVLEEWQEIDQPDLREFVPGDVIRHDPFEVEAIQVTHSIPDGCGFAFRTPHGLIVHSGDFKLDQTPVDGRVTDMAHFARLGDEGVDLLLADSTNADQPGHVATEQSVGANLRTHIEGAEGLVAVASFSSHVHRVQQVIDAAREVGRRPVFVGRSMETNTDIATDLGYLEFDAEREVPMHDVGRHDPRELIVICTGSQGEPYSALSLMASGDHKHLSVGEGDLIILASSLIPGNEHAVYSSINGLARRGCKVIHQGVADVHVSGHAKRGELLEFHNLVEPEFFTGVHGEYRHLRAHHDLAVETGCLPEHAIICEDGDTLLLEDNRVRRGEGFNAGQVFIDGLLTDVGPAVLRHRQRLAADGVCVCVVTVDPHAGKPVGDPLVIQHGVVYDEQEQDVLAAVTKAVVRELDGLKSQKFTDAAAVQRHVTQALGTYWRGEVGRRPVLLPIVLET